MNGIRTKGTMKYDARQKHAHLTPSGRQGENRFVILANVAKAAKVANLKGKLATLAALARSGSQKISRGYYATIHVPYPIRENVRAWNWVGYTRFSVNWSLLNPPH